MIFNKNGTVFINFTVGFGNNLFQYCYGRLLAEKYGMKMWHRAIPEMQVKAKRDLINPFLPIVKLNTDKVGDRSFTKYLEQEREKSCNYYLNGYFENYEIYKPYLEQIRSWFPKVEITNKKDVIIHIRLQNRLVQAGSMRSMVPVSEYIKALEKFSDYENVHIVTDAEKWEPYTMEDIQKIRDEVLSYRSKIEVVKAEVSLKYMNSLIEGFKPLNPIVHCAKPDVIENSGGLRQSFMDDFNLIRSFDRVIVHNSTFSWWAATLSGAKEVAVFEPWKPAKIQSDTNHERKENKNLGETSFPGWFPWGSAENTLGELWNLWDEENLDKINEEEK